MLQAREKAKTSGIDADNGKIINISSLNAYQGGHNIVAYVGAKHGVQGIVCFFEKVPIQHIADVHRSRPSRTAGSPEGSMSTPSRLDISRQT